MRSNNKTDVFSFFFPLTNITCKNVKHLSFFYMHEWHTSCADVSLTLYERWHSKNINSCILFLLLTELQTQYTTSVLLHVFVLKGLVMTCIYLDFFFSMLIFIPEKANWSFRWWMKLVVHMTCSILTLQWVTCDAWLFL